VSGPADKKDEDTGKRRPRGSQTARGDLPRRLGEVLTPTLDRLASGDEARAYAAWARAVGDPVTGGTRPKAFRRGQLTIECASSVWANELTYLGPQILRRMDEVAPGHPVKRFRFVLGRLPAPAPADEASVGAAPAPRRAASGGGEASVTEGFGASSGQGSGGPTAKEECRQQRPAPSAQEAARAQAEGVGDERLRAAIEAALRASSEEPPGASGDGTPSG
jgi:hypothetical protein